MANDVDTDQMPHTLSCVQSFEPVSLSFYWMKLKLLEIAPEFEKKDKQFW